MLEMIFSEWIVRVFLLYLIVVGGATLLFRDRSTPPLRFALPFLPVFLEKWGRRWVNYSYLRASSRDDRLIREMEDKWSGVHAWEDSGGTGLRYV